MRCDAELQAEPDLEAFVVLHYGELLSEKGRYAEAFESLREVSNRPAVKSRPLISAHIKSAMGASLREQGLLSQASHALQTAAEEYSAAGMAALEAYVRVVLAETLVALGRAREAEWQIAAALPTIDEQRMVPEGFAALALLREAVNRRNGDLSALSDLRKELRRS
jgi:predicted Zn-dependent protease